MVGQPRVRPSLGFVGGTLSIRPRTSELTSEDAKRLRDPIKALAVRSQTGAGDSAKADDEARLPRIATPPDGARPGTSRGTPPRLNSPTSVADETSLFTVTAKRTPHPPVVGGREVPPRELAATWERPHTSASPVRKEIPGYTGFRQGKLCQERVLRNTNVPPEFHGVVHDVSLNLSSNIVSGYHGAGTSTARMSSSQQLHGEFEPHSPRVQPAEAYRRRLGDIPGYGNFSNFMDWAHGHGRQTGGRGGGVF